MGDVLAQDNSDRIGCRHGRRGQTERLSNEVTACTHNSGKGEQTFAARMVRKFSIPVILAWLAIAVLVSVGVPSLERVAKNQQYR